jgi:hypothetical protein
MMALDMPAGDAFELNQRRLQSGLPFGLLCCLLLLHRSPTNRALRGLLFTDLSHGPSLPLRIGMRNQNRSLGCGDLLLLHEGDHQRNQGQQQRRNGKTQG